MKRCELVVMPPNVLLCKTLMNGGGGTIARENGQNVIPVKTGIQIVNIRFPPLLTIRWGMLTTCGNDK